MTAVDKEYYVRRLREEREREKTAKTPGVAQVHAELAREYEEMLRKLEGSAS